MHNINAGRRTTNFPMKAMERGPAKTRSAPKILARGTQIQNVIARCKGLSKRATVLPAEEDQVGAN